MEQKKITQQLIVADILERWPQVIPVFLEYQMKCVGCSMSAFDFLDDALKIYGIPAEQFLNDINTALSEEIDSAY